MLVPWINKMNEWMNEYKSIYPEYLLVYCKQIGATLCTKLNMNINMNIKQKRGNNM